MHAAPQARYPDAIKLRLPDGMRAALATVARRRHQTASEVVRQVLLRHLEQEGVSLGADGQVVHRDAVQPEGSA